MFVTTLGMDNFDCTKINAHLKKFTACLREELIHEWKQALLAPPLPLAKQLTALFHTQTLFNFSTASYNQRYLCILVKAQPSTRSTGPRSPTRLGIRSQDLGLPDECSLATVAFLLLLDASLLSQGGLMHYSQQLTPQHSTKLLFVFYLFFFFLSRSKLIFKVLTTT